MPINMSDDWRENGPVEDDREFDDDGNEVEPDYCDFCLKRIINGACDCAGNGDY